MQLTSHSSDDVPQCSQRFEDVLDDWFEDAKQLLLRRTELFMHGRKMEICASFNEDSGKEKTRVAQLPSNEFAVLEYMAPDVEDFTVNSDTAHRSAKVLVSLDDEQPECESLPALQPSTTRSSKCSSVVEKVSHRSRIGTASVVQDMSEDDWSAKGTLPSIPEQARPSVGSFTSKEIISLEEDEEEEDEEDLGNLMQIKVEGAFSSSFLAGCAFSELDAPQYCVENLYKATGFAQALVRSENFINFTLFVIAANAIYIGVDTDWNDSDTLYNAHAFFIIADNLFCFYFVFELLMRLHAFRRKKDSLQDGWFRFDSCLVVFMVGETWILAPALALVNKASSVFGAPVGTLRLMRLARLTRIARLMRYFPELVTTTKGMFLAGRAVASSLLMIMFMVYTFSIVLCVTLKQQESINEQLNPRNFSSVTSTMFTLLIDGTFMDSPGIVLQALFFSSNVNRIVACAIFMLFILMAAVTTLNMLVGILCEVVNTLCHNERESAAISALKSSILLHLLEFDDGDKMISHQEFMAVLSDQHSKRVLKSLNIDRLFLLELKTLLFPRPDSVVAIKGIMEFMLMCRGDVPVTVRHIASVFASNLSMMQKFEDRLTLQIDRLEGHFYVGKGKAYKAVRQSI